MNIEDRRQPNPTAACVEEPRKPRRVVDVIDEALAKHHREIARLLELRNSTDPKVLNMKQDDLAGLVYPYGPF